jgi:hypothetical protein
MFRFPDSGDNRLRGKGDTQVTIRCDRCKATLEVSYQSSLALGHMAKPPVCGVCGTGRLRVQTRPPVHNGLVENRASNYIAG